MTIEILFELLLLKLLLILLFFWLVGENLLILNDKVPIIGLVNTIIDYYLLLIDLLRIILELSSGKLC